MNVQRSKIMPLSQHLLNSVIGSDYYLSHFAYIVLIMYGDRRTIEDIVSKNGPMQLSPQMLQLAQTFDIDPVRFYDFTRGDKKQICLNLTTYARRLSERLPAEDRRGFAALSATRDAYEFGWYSQFYCDSRYTDSTVGGSMEPFSQHPRT